MHIYIYIHTYMYALCVYIRGWYTHIYIHAVIRINALCTHIYINVRVRSRVVYIHMHAINRRDVTHTFSEPIHFPSVSVPPRRILHVSSAGMVTHIRCCDMSVWYEGKRPIRRLQSCAKATRTRCCYCNWHAVLQLPKRHAVLHLRLTRGAATAKGTRCCNCK